MMTIKRLFTVLLFAGISSCETEVDSDDLLDQVELTIITGYISPQDLTLKVQVSKSKSILLKKIDDINELVISNATVVISDEEENEITLFFNDRTLNYEADASKFPIIPEKKYFLSVKVGDIEYKASCTIPKNKIETISHNIGKPKENDFLIAESKLTVSIQDIENVKNYYVFGAKIIEVTIDSDEESNEFGRLLDFESDQFATDNNRENATLSASALFESNKNFLQGQKLKIRVANTEKILFQALRSSYLNTLNEGNAFIEPVIPPNNIKGENGFGVFAGYQITIKEVVF